MELIVARLLVALAPQARKIAGTAVAIAAVIAALAMMMLVGLVGSSASSSADPLAGCDNRTVEPTSESPGVDDEQRTNAATIIDTGRTLAVPTYGWVVAIATALGESNLHNLDYGDRDSLGLFQQRPSQGWGTPEQVRDPVYASTAFYERLLAVPGWEDMPVTVAAQSVQRSAFPTGYARHEALARQIVTDLGGTATTTGCVTTGPVIVVGDSITLGATGDLERLIPAVTIDAAVGRRLDQGLELLPGHDLAGATLVIALCTNYGGDQPTFAAQIDQAMTLAADATTVVWVTCTEWSPAQAAANAAIRDAQTRHPAMAVAEWAGPSLTAGHLGPDGIHPTATGSTAYAQTIADAIPTRTGTVDASGYALPLPERFIVPPLTEHHDGRAALDLAAPPGTPVFAITGGAVTYTSEGNACGNGLIITDNSNATWTYCHMTELIATNGSTLAAGQQLGTVGSTGRSTGPHLHLDLVDPTGKPRCPQPLIVALALGQPVPALDAVPVSPPCVPVPLVPNR